MNICPDCGNHIQPWAHGTCYTCERIAKEHKRFGRRRPLKRHLRAVGSKRSQKKSRRPQPTKKCSICGRDVRRDRLASHYWHAHSLRPYASDKEWQQARRKANRRPAPKPSFRPRKKKSRKCPICGYLVPLDRVVAHKLYHLKAGTPALSGQGKRSGEQSAPMSATVRRSVSDINRLLKELFGRPTYLSGLLAQAGLSQNDIACLRDNHLDQYLERLMLHWIAWWETLLLPISVTVLRKHYDRLSSWSEADRKRLIRHSVQQRRRALAAALAKLRLDMNRQKLAEIAIVEARAILDGEGPQTRSKHVSQ